MKKFNVNVCVSDGSFNSNSHIWAEDIYNAVDKAKAMANLMGAENITNISIYEEFVCSPKDKKTRYEEQSKEYKKPREYEEL